MRRPDVIVEVSGTVYRVSPSNWRKFVEARTQANVSGMNLDILKEIAHLDFQNVESYNTEDFRDILSDLELQEEKTAENKENLGHAAMAGAVFGSMIPVA